MIIRPFKEFMFNVIEISNHVFLLALLVYLFALNNSEKWTDSNKDWFMIVIMANMVVIVGLVIGMPSSS